MLSSEQLFVVKFEKNLVVKTDASHIPNFLPTAAYNLQLTTTQVKVGPTNHSRILELKIQYFKLLGYQCYKPTNLQYFHKSKILMHDAPCMS